MNNECLDCQYRSKIDKSFCNNYLLNINECYTECKNDNYREIILFQTKNRNWLTVDEITELKRTNNL